MTGLPPEVIAQIRAADPDDIPGQAALAWGLLTPFHEKTGYTAPQIDRDRFGKKRVDDGGHEPRYKRDRQNSLDPAFRHDLLPRFQNADQIELKKRTDG